MGSACGGRSAGLIGMMICNDRRWPESYRVMGLQGVEMILCGYNTPIHYVPDPSQDILQGFHNALVMQSGAYQNGTWVVGVAKGGVEEGVDSLAQSMIVAPSGQIVAQALTTDDELVVARCDLDWCKRYKDTLFDFDRYRRPEVYRRITSQTRRGRAAEPSRPSWERRPRDWCAATITCTRRWPGACRRRRSSRPAFLEILEQIWWRLDVALDEEMIRWSAMLGAAEALQCGTTAIIDHHESPSAIDGSLSIIADACAEVGVRVSCAYGVTDRHGAARGAARALAENERFLRAGGRGMVGVHAAFTCSRRDAGGRRRAGRRPRRRRAHPRRRGPRRLARRRPAGTPRRRRLAARPLRPPRPPAARHDRPQPALEHEQRRRLRPPDRAGPTRSCSAPTASAPTCWRRPAWPTCACATDDVRPSPDTVWTWLEDGYALLPRGRDDRVDVELRPRRQRVARRVHAGDARPRRRPRRRRGGAARRPADRVDLDEVRAKAAEQAARLFAQL